MLGTHDKFWFFENDYHLIGSICSAQRIPFKIVKRNYCDDAFIIRMLVSDFRRVQVFMKRLKGKELSATETLLT